MHAPQGTKRKAPPISAAKQSQKVQVVESQTGPSTIHLPPISTPRQSQKVQVAGSMAGSPVFHFHGATTVYVQSPVTPSHPPPISSTSSPSIMHSSYSRSFSSPDASFTSPCSILAPLVLKTKTAHVATSNAVPDCSPPVSYTRSWSGGKKEMVNLLPILNAFRIPTGNSQAKMCSLCWALGKREHEYRHSLTRCTTILVFGADYKNFRQKYRIPEKHCFGCMTPSRFTSLGVCLLSCFKVGLWGGEPTDRIGFPQEPYGNVHRFERVCAWADCILPLAYGVLFNSELNARYGSFLVSQGWAAECTLESDYNTQKKYWDWLSQTRGDQLSPALGLVAHIAQVVGQP